MSITSLRGRVPESLKIAKRFATRMMRSATEKVVVRRVAQRLKGDTPSDRRRAAGDRLTPHVLILRYKYYGPDEAMGDATEAFIVQNTLAASRLATFDSFFWDTDYAGFPSGDERLLSLCRDVEPDAIFLSSYEPDNPRQPSVETLRVLRKTWNIPIVAFWWDTCWDGFWRSIRPMLPLVDVHVVGDNPCLNFLEGVDAARRRRFLGLWTSLDPRFYTNPNRSRDIDVAFLGQVAGYRSERLPYIECLQEHHIPLYSSLSVRSRQPSHEMYVDVLQRSKIGLNFSHSVSTHQLKGRVFETMRCGALLLESENPQTRRYFTPMEDYVPFTTPADLVDKIRYYLAHDAEREAIAANGERKARELYNHDIYWARIFDALREARTWPL